ncbi:MAG: lipopolysaccharide assembly protein LapA domain-containing protein, partial [Cellulomonas sp.]
NQETVEVHYLGLAGSLPLGTALLIAAVAGGVIVMIVGVVRLTQLRVNARRARRREAGVATRRAVPHPGPDSRTTGGSGATR